jgi:hypothetical protein
VSRKRAYLPLPLELSLFGLDGGTEMPFGNGVFEALQVALVAAARDITRNRPRRGRRVRAIALHASKPVAESPT